MSDETQDKATVLIVDDDRVLRRQLYWALEVGLSRIGPTRFRVAHEQQGLHRKTGGINNSRL